MNKEQRKKILHDVADLAEMNLKNDGKLAPVALIMHHGQLLAPMLITWEDDAEKERGYKVLGATCKTMLSDGVVVINDVCFRRFASPEEAQKVVDQDGRLLDETERPRAYPESMRTEAILVQYFDFVTRDSSAVQKTYKKIGEEFKINPTEEIEDKLKGGIQNAILYGYDHHEAFPEVAEVLRGLPRRS